MKTFQQTVKRLSISICLFCIFVHSSSLFIPINENLNEGIVNDAKCVLDICETHFMFGSIVGLVTAGLQNYSSANLSMYSPDLTLNNIMLSESWSIVVKQVYHSRTTETKVYKYIAYSFRKLYPNF